MELSHPAAHIPSLDPTLSASSPSPAVNATGGIKTVEDEHLVSPEFKIRTEVLTLGGILGACTGYFVKKIGKVVMFATGGLFVLVQVRLFKPQL